MNRKNAIWAVIILYVMTGCGGGSKQSTDDLITVDVTKSYPKKELILQDIFDVEYVHLDDTQDEFLTQGIVHDVGEQFMLVRNLGIAGDILVFDRQGKGVRTFNRRGQGPEEYPRMAQLVLDEDNKEIFVVAEQNIVVYDLFGNFQRKLALPGRLGINFLNNFDRDNLIGAVNFLTGDNFVNLENRFFIMSKKDGNITQIIIPFEKRLETRIYMGDSYDAGPSNQILISNRNSGVLVEISSDTIYRLQPDLSMVPVIVRTPSVQSMNPEVFLFPSVFTDRYLFMQTVKKQILTRTGNFTSTYPRNNLIYDMQEKAIFEYTIYNDDFSTKTPVNLAFESISSMPFLHKEIVFMQKFESYELVDAYEKGELKGKLKDVAAKLNAESNPVIMLLKHKK